MGTRIIKTDLRTVLIQIMVAVANELLHYKNNVGLVSCAVATQNFRRTKLTLWSGTILKLFDDLNLLYNFDWV